MGRGPWEGLSQRLGQASGAGYVIQPKRGPVNRVEEAQLWGSLPATPTVPTGLGGAVPAGHASGPPL